MDALYTTHATANAGRDGHAESQDGRLSVALSNPLKPGRAATGTDPEQLFACGYAACFGSAVALMAQKAGVTPNGDISVASTVSLGKNDKGEGFTVAVKLDVTIPGVEAAQAADMVAKAHQVCPYSNATRGNIEVMLSANGQEI